MSHPVTIPALLAGLALLSLPAALAAGEPFPELFNTEPDPDAAPMPAAEAATAFELPKGFRATVFAAEPEVQNPIAMAWDHRGRLWVAENFTYAERATRFDMTLRDRVLIFEDSDHDGKADHRSVFTDDVQMLTSVEVGRGGAWLMCPPQLLFIPDRDGDDVPDGAPEVVLDGFTVAQSNYHNYANGLRWGPDGWLYGRCGHSCPGRLGAPGTPDEDRIPIEGGIWRYHPERETVEVLTHGTVNPWGHDWNEHGELFFVNTVIGHFWHCFPGAHHKESFGSDPNPDVYERLDHHADHYHYDRSGGDPDLKDDLGNEFGGGHVHIGAMIYQADQWPEKFRGRLFTLNQHGRRANMERIERAGSGYVGRHEPDVFIAGDEWFRGIDIQQGPDGSAYLIDWSDTGECHEHTGVHRTSGRIYRISHGTPEQPDLSDFANSHLDLDAVERLLKHPNAWFERQLRLRLASAPSPDEVRQEIAAALRKAVAGKEDPVIRLRALWTLHALSETAPGLLRGLIGEKDEHLRAWAIRLLTDHQSLDTIMGPLPNRMPEPLPGGDLERLVAMARTDQSGLVRLTLASTLQRLPLAQRAALGAALAARTEDAGDHNLPAMVWYGLIPLADADPTALVQVAENCRWPDTLRWIARALARRIEDHPGAVDSLLRIAAGNQGDPDLQFALLQGLNDGLQGWRKAPVPESWDALLAALPDQPAPAIATLTRELSVLFGDGRALAEIRKTALDQQADRNMRVAALETLIDQRPPDLRDLCESLLDDRSVNAVAVRGLASFDDPALGQNLARSYRRFPPLERPALIDVLASRPAWARALLAEMEAGKIPRAELSAFQARQVRAFNDEDLNRALARAWGEVRDSPGDKRRLIEEWKTKFTGESLGGADLGKGRLLFQGVCGACHVMYGEGGKIGPDLTGSGRADLDYLLENIFDPGAVVSADYQVSLLSLDDGRVLTGVIAAENERTLTLHQATGELTVAQAQITGRELSPMSMMPDGLLLAFGPEQIHDLIAYLRHPRQVPLPLPESTAGQ